MEARFNFMNDMVNKNHESFREFQNIKWINPYEALIYEEKRDRLINQFSPLVNWSFKKTKPWINSISKGCDLCGKGEWSCLFITGRCNASCFYCPASQNSDDTPMAQQLLFESADEYASFINYFNFKGCSFSGGEPFLVFEKVKEFLSIIRQKCNPDLYIWMYTNGILGTEDKFRELANLGLNEVRFDIGATNYKIDTIKNASGIIQNITVEIPIDPEKTELIKRIIPQLENLGVTNLNLHQMRLTKYNASKLLTRDYTYLHGEHPTVLESEIAALEIIDFVDSNNYKIGVNYCAFQYKNRFQKAGYRTKILNKVIENEDITENGYILKLYTSENPEFLVKIAAGRKITDFLNTKEVQKISISELLKNHFKFDFVIVDLHGVVLTNNLQNTINNEIITIENRKYVLEIGRPLEPVLILKDKLNNLVQLFQDLHNQEIPADEELFQIWKYFTIENGFRPYF